MMIRTCFTIAALLAVLAARLGQAEPPVVSPSAKPVIILKLDDVTRSGARGQAPVSPRWQRCADFLARENVKASFGIIGFSLEGDAPAYFDWIKAHHKKGLIEFWNHGYGDRKATDPQGEFEGDSLDEQKAALDRTQRLAKKKLGLTLRAFGAHWSGTNAVTDTALTFHPEIVIWFFGPTHPKGKQLVLKRTVNLEVPTFAPNFAKVKAGFEQQGGRLPYLVLQGHPNQWDDQRFEEFARVVSYLKAQGCVFMTPSEYLKTQASRTP